ncbi:glutaredoxin domain-containing protein [Kiloniella antarctica]|uniref:Glutaredoxin domain-containing protein n=1 Tax=Kiloniella antarctica TaxID=1550907 RepID=A0ABW5BMC2_9PROT
MKKQIQQNLKDQKVVLYRKGTREHSSCVFSSHMVQILDHYGVNFTSHDVLLSDDLRAGIKSYSGVKTLPQLFVDGEFVGGTDDIRNLIENDKIVPFFQEKNIEFNADKSAIRLVLNDVSRDEKIACAKQ